MKTPCEAAVLHFAAGALKAQDVPVGHHDLSRVQLTLTFPQFAAVVRAAGSTGKGYDIGEAPAPDLSLAAALRFIELAGLAGERYASWWLQAVRETERGMVTEIPPEAQAALAQLAAELPPAAPPQRKTPAKRSAADEVEIAFKRLPKGKPK